MGKKSLIDLDLKDKKVLSVQILMYQLKDGKITNDQPFQCTHSAFKYIIEQGVK